MDGFILVDKPKGITSLSVCNKIKRMFNFDKCGHNGTLDPNTTGVMVIACNRATKLLKFVNEHDKEYIAKIVFGYDSDTLDVDGNITNNINMEFTYDELVDKVKYLCSLKSQIPPLTSAIKINGMKLYEYQRKGIEVEVKARETEIYNYEILSDLVNVDNHYEIDIKLSVRKGFYVRSFARDLGQLLGGCAILKELRRTSAGEFIIDNCKTLEELSISDVKSINEVFDFKNIEVNTYISKLVMNGVMLDERQAKVEEPFNVVYNNKIIAIYEPVELYKYKPVIIFKEG